ncbi:hypothetical protein CCYS_03020 [Corynebacterium cystitidis DSM 20524]|uniref:Uncharacterized protein n=1 Tax=Corynebacterium cystitidis DSM 20524 TaxID=1121357 RepID=A0A1H9R2Q4_9CORY|nr:hypothetical protein CCYS_03020 [Corynebacterium cystitidis DSM 20524]SER66897.1 hypothetical protein SAMN05661109_00754 [Corynebacterium cystitidis DSM 20524]SNV86065.1 Uncharacterised protein [Corynebacterium cystitidis]
MTWTADASRTATSKNISLLIQGVLRTRKVVWTTPVFTSGCDGWSHVYHDPTSGNGPEQASVGVDG